ncbi:MAG TPA: hypothetical protein VFZ58_01640 [Candidatus Saccharimonadales bacterium]
MSEKEAPSSNEHEPLIHGFTPKQIRYLAQLAAEQGMPQTACWALIEHSYRAEQPNTLPLPLSFYAKYSHPDVLAMTALQHIKRQQRHRP